MSGFDPEIMQDFITESGELLEQVEADLVELESRPEDLDLLNQIFRALHTIKGSASFLALTELVEIAHAGESALNAARNQQIVVGSGEMDLLLAAIDIIKVQFDEIVEGTGALSKADQALIDQLTKIGNGEAVGGSSAPADVPGTEESETPARVYNDERTVEPLDLDPSKLDLIDPLTADVEESIQSIQDKLQGVRDAQTRESSVNNLIEEIEELDKTVDFFGIEATSALVAILKKGVEALKDASDETLIQLTPRLEGVATLIEVHNAALRDKEVVSWDTTTLFAHITTLTESGTLDTHQLEDDSTGVEALQIDGIPFGVEPDEAGEAVATSSAPAQGQDQNVQKSGAAKSQIEQTIRVDIERLETLMNLVGELVLQKNRVLGMAEEFGKMNQVESTLAEQMEFTAGTLDRVTGDIQMAVMRTRMQPLNKLFGKYPRLIRDLASKTGKEMNLVIEGGDTEVDKSVIEELGDPLVHLLRNSGDHGIETPDVREANGKPRAGTITLQAGHEGSHVCVRVIDDGRGLSRDKIGAKAVERGLVSEEQLEHLSDEEVFRFILQAGFSTAEVVSDISGRGVGMDVVRTNIESKLKGSLTIESTEGKGTVLTITIPLTLAIMPAMMVSTADEIYAIALSNILEIVRPEPGEISSVDGYPVIHLRGAVLPIISAQEVLGVKNTRHGDEDFIVVISHAGKNIGLRVSRVIGQQEIVMKPLDGVERDGPVSGATILNDGGVGLIIDIARLISITSKQARAVQAAGAS